MFSNIKVENNSINPYRLDAARLMLDNGKNVLVEKPLTLNLKCTRELIACAKRHNLFLMEAQWSRFMPSHDFVMDSIRKGIIGDVYHVSVTFGITKVEQGESYSRNLGGGTMLDFGIYTLTIIEMVFGGEFPHEIRAVGNLTEEGADESVSVALKFSKGRTASLATSARILLPNEAHIVGTKGVLKLPFPFHCADKVFLNNVQYDFEFPPTAEPCNFWNSSGLRYEAMDVRRCLNSRKLESDVMSHKDSELLAKISDEIR